MKRVEWDGSLETGHELVDDQHRELISIFNEIADATCPGCDPANTTGLLVRLSEYVSTHFACEEQLMSKYAYPESAAEAHREQHEQLSQRTRDLVLEHRLGGTATILPLVALLQEWLADHIGVEDARLVEYIRAQAAGQAS